MTYTVWKKAVCLLLAVLFISFSVLGCRKGSEESATTALETGVYDQEACFLTSYLSDAVIVYSKSGGSAISEIAFSLKSVFEGVFGVEIKVREENNTTDATYEIVIGKTNRTAGEDIVSTLQLEDTTMGVIDNTLLLVGGSVEATMSLVSSFIKTVRGMNASTDTLFSNVDAKTVYADAVYHHSSVTMNGKPLSTYVIVYPHKSSFDVLKEKSAEKEAAVLIQERIKAETGFELRLVSDTAKEAACEVLVGRTNRSASAMFDEGLQAVSGDDIYINGANTKIVLGASSYTGIVNAGLSFVENHISKEIKGKPLSITIGEAQTYDETSLIRVLNWNIYHHGAAVSGSIPAATDPKGWNTKKCMEMVLDRVEDVQPDVFITQETNDYWLVYLLDKIGDKYTWAYTRSNGQTRNEQYNAIFYRKDKLRLVDNGMFWFSDTPKKFSNFDFTPTSAIEGTCTNGLATPRFATWAKLEVKATGKRFMAMSCHLDPFNGGGKYKEEGPLRGEKQMQVILNFINKNKDWPVIIGGDFNLKKTNNGVKARTPYQVLDDDPRMKEAGSLAWYANTTDNKVDWVFASQDSIEVLYYESMTIKKYANNRIVAQESDHPAQYTLMYLK